MTNYRSSLKPPERGEFLVFTDAAYGPDNRPICSFCWSQLDYSWGKGHDGGEPLEQLEGNRGEDWVDKCGESWLVWNDINRCMNQTCQTANHFRYLPVLLSFKTPYHPDDLKTRRLKGKDLKKFKTGKYNDNGIFLIKNKPIEVLPPDYGVVVEVEGRWAWIWPGDLRSDIPPTWTIKDDWIKTNMNSKRYNKIVTWFAQRRIHLEELIEETNDVQEE